MRILSFVLLSTLALASCGEEKKQQKVEDVLPVVVHKVHFETQAKHKTFSATIKPRLESDLGFRVGGKLQKRVVDLGQSVKAGQVLAQLDTNTYQLQIEQANAELKAAQISLKQVQDELGRQKELLDKGYVPMSAYDKQRAAEGEAVARFERTKRLVELAQNDLNYTDLRADVDGVVTAVLAENGQVVAVGQPIVRLAKAQEFEALIAVPEADLDFVKRTDGALTLWAQKGKSYGVALRELSSSADPLTRTYSARFGITNPDADLRYGLSAELTLTEAKGVVSASMPMSALYNQTGTPSVWRVDGAKGTVELVKVEIGQSNGKTVAIVSGLQEGDEVVAMGVHKLDAGKRVKIVPLYGS